MKDIDDYFFDEVNTIFELKRTTDIVLRNRNKTNHYVTLMICGFNSFLLCESALTNYTNKLKRMKIPCSGKELSKDYCFFHDIISSGKYKSQKLLEQGLMFEGMRESLIKYVEKCEEYKSILENSNIELKLPNKQIESAEKIYNLMKKPGNPRKKLNKLSKILDEVNEIGPLRLRLLTSLSSYEYRKKSKQENQYLTYYKGIEKVTEITKGFYKNANDNDLVSLICGLNSFSLFKSSVVF